VSAPLPDTPAGAEVRQRSPPPDPCWILLTMRQSSPARATEQDGRVAAHIDVTLARVGNARVRFAVTRGNADYRCPTSALALVTAPKSIGLDDQQQ
jgi:hypothetical protein